MGEKQLREISTAKVLVPSRTTDSGRVVVNVVTREGLDELLLKVARDIELLDDKLKPQWTAFLPRALAALPPAK